MPQSNAALVETTCAVASPNPRIPACSAEASSKWPAMEGWRTLHLGREAGESTQWPTNKWDRR